MTPAGRRRHAAPRNSHSPPRAGNSCFRNAKLAEISITAQRSPWKARDCREAKRVSTSARWARWLVFWGSTDSTMAAKRVLDVEGRKQHWELAQLLDIQVL